MNLYLTNNIVSRIHLVHSIIVQTQLMYRLSSCNNSMIRRESWNSVGVSLTLKNKYKPLNGQNWNKKKKYSCWNKYVLKGIWAIRHALFDGAFKANYCLRVSVAMIVWKYSTLLNIKCRNGYTFTCIDFLYSVYLCWIIFCRQYAYVH